MPLPTHGALPTIRLAPVSFEDRGSNSVQGGSRSFCQATYYYLVRKYVAKIFGEVLVLGVENVFKIATAYSSVRDFLTSTGWEYQGKDEEMEMDSFRNKKTGRMLFVEDISEDFPVTFLMGELSVAEFGDIATGLKPGIALLEVDSSWEGKPTTIEVAMTEAEVRNMFGRRTKMRKIAVHGPASQI